MWNTIEDYITSHVVFNVVNESRKRTDRSKNSFLVESKYTLEC